MAALTKKGDWWYAVLRETDATGKRKQVWVGLKTKRKKEAKAKLVDLQHKQQEGTFVLPAKATLVEFINLWLETHSARIRTMEAYRGKLDHAVAALGEVKLKDLEPEMLQGLYQRLLKTGRRDGKPGGLSPQSVKHVHTALHVALADAVKWGKLYRNPADHVTPPKVKKKEIRVMSPEEIHLLMGEIKKTVYHPLFFTLLYTGLRRSEAMALRWSDIDLDSATLSVSRSLHQVKGARAPIFEDPKNPASRRLVDLEPTTIAMLRRHQEHQQAQFNTLDQAWTQDTMVYCRTDGTPLLPNTVTHSFIKMVRRAGLDGVRLHDLRHTHATVLLKQGIHPKVVQERLGHSNIGVTLDTYSHVVPGMGKAAALSFADSLQSVSSKMIEEAVADSP